MSTAFTRRQFLAATAGATAYAQQPGQRPQQDASVEVLNPRERVPVSFIIDDSTCLVNLNHFSIPQFRAAYQGKRYFQDWRSMPREIPDSFVRRFGEWCAENGVKGKYSIVPYPACVGRLDRELPGWSRKELADSIALVRELMAPNWDIHPEMVTHTRVIDTRTGHPYPELSPRYMENWDWTTGRSVDELAEYMRYGLNILRNIGLPCEGLTTPGSFAAQVLPELAQATLESCRDVFHAEIPHYFRHGFASGDQSVAPRVEYVSGLGTADPKCVVSIIACTGDWTGSWDCANRGYVDRFITTDLSGGRLVEIVERGEPTCLMCHWTGIYFNGEEVGFKVFQEAVRRLHAKYDHLQWMKLAEIARYWAAKELTAMRTEPGRILLDAPYACPEFTLRFRRGGGAPSVDGKPLREVRDALALESGTWRRDGELAVACFDLPKGHSVVAA